MSFFSVNIWLSRLRSTSQTFYIMPFLMCTLNRCSIPGLSIYRQGSISVLFFLHCRLCLCTINTIIPLQSTAWSVSLVADLAWVRTPWVVGAWPGCHTSLGTLPPCTRASGRGRLPSGPFWHFFLRFRSSFLKIAVAQIRSS